MKKILLFIAAISSIISCEKEELIEPFVEPNWYYIEYRDDMDEVDQKIYDIYIKHGVAIFYKDTIGVEDRGWKDINGNTNYYYEILKIGYDPDFSKVYILEYETPDVSTPEKKNELLPLLKIIDEYLLPGVEKTDFFLPCIFLVEYIHSDMEYEYLAFRSFNFMAMAKNQLIKGGMGDVNDYIYEFWIEFLSNVLPSSLNIYYDLVTSSMSKLNITEAIKLNPYGMTFASIDSRFSEQYQLLLNYENALIEIPKLEAERDSLEDLLDKMSPLDPEFMTVIKKYSDVLDQIALENDWIIIFEVAIRDTFYSETIKRIHNYGFLAFSPSKGDGRSCLPTKDEDLLMYFDLVFSFTYDEVNEKWGDYPYVMARYEELCEVLISNNVDIEFIRNIIKSLNN